MTFLSNCSPVIPSHKTVCPDVGKSAIFIQPHDIKSIIEGIQLIIEDSAKCKELSKQGKQANDLFSIATKAAICRDPETGERSFNNTLSHLESELDKSLERMNIDYVDLFYD